MTDKTHSDTGGQPDMASRAVLEGLASRFAELSALRDKQRGTMALMLKLCIMRIESPDSRKRKEGVAALKELLALMEESTSQ